MPQAHFTSLLVGWEGYTVKQGERIDPAEAGQRARVEIVLVRTKPMFRRSRCGRETTGIHEMTIRCIHDLPILEADTYVWVPRYRVACATCGPKIEELSWLSPWARVTRRLAESVRLCRVLPIQHIAEFYGLDWDTIKTLDVAALAERLLPVDLSTVEVIAMDEFALRKGHRYATVVVEPSRKRVLWVSPGRSREDIRPFFALLGPKGCQRLQAVVMNMNPAYEEEVPARHTSLLEGINNKIKVLKRMAYGYRDDGYFFLKIMDALPGVPRVPGVA